MTGGALRRAQTSPNTSNATTSHPPTPPTYSENLCNAYKDDLTRRNESIAREFLPEVKYRGAKFKSAGGSIFPPVEPSASVELTLDIRNPFPVSFTVESHHIELHDKTGGGRVGHGDISRHVIPPSTTHSIPAIMTIQGVENVLQVTGEFASGGFRVQYKGTADVRAVMEDPEGGCVTVDVGRSNAHTKNASVCSAAMQCPYLVNNTNWRSLGGNLFEENAGTGGHGGSCTCPDGQVYQVGDNGNSCGSLACFGGVSGPCNGRSGPWSGNRVICSPPLHNVFEANAGSGGHGGSCTCPDGQVYQVGDMGNNCGSLACVGGTEGRCNGHDGDWSGNKVTCGGLDPHPEYDHLRFSVSQACHTHLTSI